MSDTGQHRRIRAQASPRDPSTMRFILDAPVQAGRTASFDGPDDEAPLAKALFAIDGVRKVQVTGETILYANCSPAMIRATVSRIRPDSACVDAGPFGT